MSRMAGAGAYLESVKTAERVIPKAAIFAFNTCIDAVWHVDSLIEKADLPREMVPLLEAMSTGEGGEARINAETAEFIRTHFPFSDRRMGGQAGNAANTAARLGVRGLLHAANASGTQKMVLEHNVKCVGGRHGEPSVHYVFEFSEGQRLMGLEVPESGRLIFTHDPANEEMRIGTEFKKATLMHAAEYGCALVAGFHLLDEEKAGHKVDEVAALMRLWKKANPAMKIHVELGDFASKKVLSAVLHRVLKYADSFGMNEVELRDAAAALGVKGRNEFEVAARLFEKLPHHLCELVVHEKGYSFAFSRRRGKDALRQGMRFAHALAGFKAAKGRNASFLDLEHFHSRKHAHSKEFAAAEKRFAKLKMRNAAIVPAPGVEPRFTVGLGDAYAAGWLLML